MTHAMPSFTPEPATALATWSVMSTMSPSSLVFTLKEVEATIIGFQSRLLAVAYILFAVTHEVLEHTVQHTPAPNPESI
jgi:hypothetical protein